MSFDQAVRDKQIRFNAWNASINLVITSKGGTFTSLLPDGEIGPMSEAAFAQMSSAQSNWLQDEPPPVEGAVDSLMAVDASLLELAQKALRGNPIWWGRYNSDFNNPTKLGINAAECALLSQAGIPLQLVAANAARLGTIAGGQAIGASEGARDVRLLQEASAIAPTLLKRVFLDVEGGSNLNPDFYVGWSNTLAAAGWEPAVYMPNRLHPTQWKALHAALAKKAPCACSWSAWYPYSATQYMAVPWDPQYAHNDDALDVAWQYIGAAYEDKLDFTVIKPGAAKWW